jgi:HAD superfamily hydrolase (TIGR01484 family)
MPDITQSRPDLRLISTDFDGTIHEDFAHSPIPILLQEKLQRLRGQGVVWVINTGRDLSSLMESLGREHCQVLPDYVVTVEREIHRHVRGRYESVEPWNGQCMRDHAKIFTELSVEVQHLTRHLDEKYDATFYDDSWSPLCVIARSNAQMDLIQAELDTFCSEVKRLTVVRNDVYLRMSHRGYSKGTALQEIQRQLGITAAQTLAAGDHLNDIPMLQRSVAEWLVTPSNGLPQIQALVAGQGGYICKASCGEGILEALEHHGF